MCMQDLWIMRHTVARFEGSAASFTLPADLSRLAIVVSNDLSVNLSGPTGQYWAVVTAGVTTTTESISITTQVPPGTDTGTITRTGGATLLNSRIFHVRDWGALVTDRVTVTMNGGAAPLWTLNMDAALQQKMSELEQAEGWPFYGANRG